MIQLAKMSVNIPSSEIISFENKCFTCLSADRNLKPLKEKSVMAMVCPEIYLNPTFIGCHLICWECDATILKIKRFKNKVTQVQNLLKKAFQDNVLLHSFSNLTRTAVETLTVSPNSTVTSQTVISHLSPELVTKQEHFKIVEIKTEKMETSDYRELKEERVSDDTSDSDGNEEDELIIPGAVDQMSSAVNSDFHMGAYDDPLLPVQNKIEVQVDFSAPVETEVIQNPFSPEMISFDFPPLPPKVPVPKAKAITVQKNTKEIARVTIGVPKVIKNSKGEAKSGANGVEDDEVVSKILNREEMLKFREVKRNHHNFKGVRYSCVKCLEKFASQEDLDTHNKKHDEEHGEYMCDVCEQRFTDSADKELHYDTHFLVYECLTCGFQSHERKQVTDHRRKIHRISEFVCRKCNAVFNTYREQRKHRLKEHYEKPTCTECGKEFCSRSSYKSHMSKHTGQLEECKVCKKKVTRLGLKSHMKTHENKPDDMMYCAECGTTYKNKLCYSIHLKTSLKHNTIEQLGIKCEYCGKSFAYKSTLLDHIDIEHTKTGDCVCDICSKCFKTKRRLARHIRINHSGKKSKQNRMCEICGKSFTNRTSLLHHINSHLGHRPFKCQDCGDTFSYSASLYTHRRLVHKVKRKREMKN